jgi:hypothetical protein
MRLLGIRRLGCELRILPLLRAHFVGVEREQRQLERRDCARQRDQADAGHGRDQPQPKQLKPA